MSLTTFTQNLKPQNPAAEIKWLKQGLLNAIVGGSQTPKPTNNTYIIGGRTLTNFYEKNINTATLGASGAVFGILAAFIYLFPNTYIYIYFLFPIKAKWIGLLYFSYEFFFALKNSAGDNVARWAHIGGAIVGLLIVITWNKTRKKTFY